MSKLLYWTVYIHVWGSCPLKWHESAITGLKTIRGIKLYGEWWHYKEYLLMIASLKFVYEKPLIEYKKCLEIKSEHQRNISRWCNDLRVYLILFLTFASACRKQRYTYLVWWDLSLSRHFISLHLYSLHHWRVRSKAPTIEWEDDKIRSMMLTSQGQRCSLVHMTLPPCNMMSQTR